MSKVAFVVTDLETLSTHVAIAPILSIGAAVLGVVNTEEGNWVDELHYKGFHEIVNYPEQLKFDKFVSKTTLDWWENQNDDAKKLLETSRTTSNNLVQSLISLCGWINSIKADHVVVLGYGSNFDNAILEINYQEYGIPIPWEYRNSLCLRTILNLYTPVEEENSIEAVKKEAAIYTKFILQEEFCKHNALHDAVYESAKARIMFPLPFWLTIARHIIK
jgi:hypothetical protein